MTGTREKEQMMDPVRDCQMPLPLGRFRVGGLIEHRLAKVLSARILSDFARDQILSEAEEAFRARIDDRMEPGIGVWQGEFWGKWMLSAVEACRYTDSEALTQTIRKSAQKMLATQDACGYIGTYHESGFVNSRAGFCWNVWCRKYTLWGLLAAYELVREETILEGAGRMMDHLMTQVGPRADPIIRTGWCQGLASTSILSPVVRLYRLTEESRYLDYARYIVDQWQHHPDGPPDLFRKGLGGAPIHTWFPDKNWVKAYEFVSCVEGLLDLYRVTNEQPYLAAASNIQQDICASERLLIGGLGDDDHMRRASLKPEVITEVCDAVYWVRLNAQLLRLTGEPRYADEIERTLYNMLCAASSGDGSWGCRRLALSGRHRVAPKHCNLEHHHCCVANLPRGLLQSVEHAVTLDEHGIVLNLYLPGQGTLKSRATGTVRFSVETEYPIGDSIRITLHPDGPSEFTLKLRIPPWAADADIRVQGEACACEPGAYARVTRCWRAGDTVTLRLPMAARAATLRHEGTEYVAFERGPLVLSRDMRLKDGDIHAPIPIDAMRAVEMVPVPAPEGISAAWDCSTGNGTSIRLCDYASAGSTWDASTSDFRVWLPHDRECDEALPSSPSPSGKTRHDGEPTRGND
jgi:uncharacterized protein